MLKQRLLPTNLDVGLNPKEFLIERLDLLDMKVPSILYEDIRGSCKIIVQNEDGTRIYGKLGYDMYLARFLDMIRFQGLMLYNFPINYESESDLKNKLQNIGRRMQRGVSLTNIRYGFDINSVNYVIYPLGDEEDFSLFNRVLSVFGKYGDFVSQERKQRYCRNLLNMSGKFTEFLRL